MGLLSTATQRGPEQALDRVEARLDADGRQDVFARVEHPDDPSEQAARAAGLELVETVDLTLGTGRVRLRPTTVVLASDPRPEAFLLGRQSTVAVDLPQRMVVYETAGYAARLHDPAYTARRHRVSGEGQAVRRLSERLKKLAGAAAR